jgi:hypothetical protein
MYLVPLGDAWGCRGWPTGGGKLCDAPGSAAFARCIDGSDLAGIFYFRTGVCHQIANRLLYPAGVKIPLGSHVQVRGSCFGYGQFGELRQNRSWVPTTHRWPERANLCGATLAGASSGSPSSISLQGTIGDGSLMTDPNHRSDLIHAKAELSSLIEAADLGHPVDDEILSQLAIVQEHLQDRIGELATLLDDKKISRLNYIEELDRAFATASIAGARAMGSVDDFHRVFGELTASQLGDVPGFLSYGDDLNR